MHLNTAPKILNLTEKCCVHCFRGSTGIVLPKKGDDTHVLNTASTCMYADTHSHPCCNQPTCVNSYLYHVAAERHTSSSCDPLSWLGCLPLQRIFQRQSCLKRCTSMRSRTKTILTCAGVKALWQRYAQDVFGISALCLVPSDLS